MTIGTTSVRFAAAASGTGLTTTAFGRPLSLLVVVTLLGAVSARGDTPESEFLPGPKTPPDYRPDRGDLDGRGLDLAKAVFVGLVPHGERFDNANLRRARFQPALTVAFRGALRGEETRLGIYNGISRDGGVGFFTSSTVACTSGVWTCADGVLRMPTSDERAFINATWRAWTFPGPKLEVPISTGLRGTNWPQRPTFAAMSCLA